LTDVPIRVGRTLDPALFREIRRTMELLHFKWDAQVGDITALAPFPLLIGEATWRTLAGFAEQLTAETLAVESELLERPELHRALALPRALHRLLARPNATPAAARIMRFDFHYTDQGWRISEVNSDVPGGYTEATEFSRLMSTHEPGSRLAGDPAGALVDSLVRAAGERGVIALTSAPFYLEDQQVVEYLAARLRQRGLAAHIVSASDLRWKDNEASIDGAGRSGRVSAIVRFYQAEWLARLPRRSAWRPLFAGGRTRVANPGVAALSESKRLPLIWDRLRTRVPTWRRLLPETRSLRAAPWSRDEHWVIKSAYSNTGDSVLVRSAMTAAAWRRRSWFLHLSPGRWIAQRRFSVAPVAYGEEKLFPCIGVYTVDGVAAGAYGRLASGVIVDGQARDAAVLVTEDR
jgi:glutathionylspermidine synthase